MDPRRNRQKRPQSTRRPLQRGSADMGGGGRVHAHSGKGQGKGEARTECEAGCGVFAVASFVETGWIYDLETRLIEKVNR
jgi:hypothetical protein